MRAVMVMGLMILGFGFAGQRARATDSATDPCSLLTAAQVSSTLGDKYGAPERSVAPATESGKATFMASARAIRMAPP